jgi:ESS family glutamate:Na+ symporter
MFSFDAIATLALATLVLLLGQLVKNRIAFLSRYNLPAPVIGGLLAATALAIAKQQGWQISFDSSLRTPMMLAFFTTLGFAASLQLLKIGGRFVFIFLAISSLAAILQNVVGASAAVMMGLPALFGVLCGSVTLTGGPATGLAFAPQFEQAGRGWCRSDCRCSSDVRHYYGWHYGRADWDIIDSSPTTTRVAFNRHR